MITHRILNQNPPQYSFTQQGYDDMVTKLSQLKEEREHIVQRLRTAREMGDLSENGAYKAARFELGSTDRQIRKYTHLIASATIITKQGNDTVQLGNTVTITSEQNAVITFLLVDQYEADPTKHMLSSKSPIGRAVLGKKQGEHVSVVAPNGIQTYTVTSIS